ncbi:hypothetical protein O7634_29630 [Micromonospora sp. WMMD1120]|nr:hypothetical protein [Micromonospora sp. WMMD1120]MDG4810939.1 hypothetical protein [Micromonospora sp. WMMD1120]
MSSRQPDRSAVVGRERLRQTPAQTPDHLPAHENVEEVERPATGGEFGVIHQQKSTVNTLAALKSICAKRADGTPIHVILDNPIEATSGRYAPS